MLKIYKYKLGEDCIYLHSNAKVLSVGLDPQNELCVWALVDTTKTKYLQQFTILGTGHDADKVDPTKFIGTVKQGSLMWHVFMS